MLGILAKVYRNTGSYGSPTWSEITVISDLAVNPTWDEGEANSRASRVKATVKTLLGIEISGKMLKKPADTNYGALMDALLSDDALDLLVLDGDKDTANIRGWRADFQVFAGNEDQAMANALYVDIVLKPTLSDNPTKAVKATGGGTLTYSIPGEDGDSFA